VIGSWSAATTSATAEELLAPHLELDVAVIEDRGPGPLIEEVQDNELGVRSHERVERVRDPSRSQLGSVQRNEQTPQGAGQTP
jgi:hypothetical protein